MQNQANILDIRFRWVATQGEHLQLFPFTFTATSVFAEDVDMPFDYSRVQWSSGTFQVQVTVVLSAMHLLPDPDQPGYTAQTVILVWDGSAYSPNGFDAVVLANDALYGLNCPFTHNGTEDVVKLRSFNYLGSELRSYILFHKVQQPNTNPYVTTGFAVAHNSFETPQNGDFTNPLESSDFNVAGVDTTAVRVYGFEQLGLYAHSMSNFYARFDTTDGITGNDHRDFKEPLFLTW